MPVNTRLREYAHIAGLVILVAIMILAFKNDIEPNLEDGNALKAEIATGVEPVRGSRLVRVTFKSPDPALSARLANAIADAVAEGIRPREIQRRLRGPLHQPGRRNGGENSAVHRRVVQRDPPDVQRPARCGRTSRRRPPPSAPSWAPPCAGHWAPCRQCRLRSRAIPFNTARRRTAIVARSRSSKLRMPNRHSRLQATEATSSCCLRTSSCQA